MAPREKLSREKILCAAYDCLREEGYESINARSLASRLGCSTMPLFRHFSGMEEIRKEAVARGVARYDEYIREGLESEIPFKGVGRAYIRFAREEPMIFRMLFMLPREKVPELPENDRNYEMVLRSAQSSSRTEREKAAEIYEKMWIFVHGVATLQAGGLLPYDEERVGKMSSEVFAALTLFEHQKEEEDDE